MNGKRAFLPGDTVSHFKRGMMTDDEIRAEPSKYLYEIIGVATDTETRGELMIYRALYGERSLFARPLEMFMSETDREKYPSSRQLYRFEKFENN